MSYVKYKYPYLSYCTYLIETMYTLIHVYYIHGVVKK